MLNCNMCIHDISLSHHRIAAEFGIQSRGPTWCKCSHQWWFSWLYVCENASNALYSLKRLYVVDTQTYNNYVNAQFSVYNNGAGPRDAAHLGILLILGEKCGLISGKLYGSATKWILAQDESTIPYESCWEANPNTAKAITRKWVICKMQ